MDFEKDSFALRPSKRCECCFDFENCISNLLWKALSMHKTTMKSIHKSGGGTPLIIYSMLGETPLPDSSTANRGRITKKIQVLPYAAFMIDVYQ